MKSGVMLCGHGSRDPDAAREFEWLVRGIRQRLPQETVGYGYLEFARPMIRDGLERLVGQGISHIRALPVMLFAAGHVKNDIPWELNSFALQQSSLPAKVTVDYGADLGLDPGLLRAASDRIEATLARADAQTEQLVERSETLLLVIGRGTSDPDANGNIAKTARMLGEGLNFGWTEIGYSGVTVPRVDTALEHAIRLGYRRIVVFPYFLFTGILVKRIYHIADQFQERHPQLEILKASYLNDHPLVLNALLARLAAIGEGNTAMNCQLCKYRTQIIGYEQDAGSPQAGHHHHVRGIGTNHDHAHDHHHEHGHNHAHG